MTFKELQCRQSWTLEQKIDHSVGVISHFLSKMDGKAYISFSGGKDSTVLLDIARRFIRRDFPAVSCNTGNEFPEIVRFVKEFNDVTIIRPKIRVPEVLDKYDFPLVSKEQSQYIRQALNTNSRKLYNLRMYGSDSRYDLFGWAETSSGFAYGKSEKSRQIIHKTKFTLQE
jgi:3'-phosphoadenosine 5'-phosphosulfate sulfotransferase (PAPS reductase)/FAD synthetase